MDVPKDIVNVKLSDTLCTLVELEVAPRQLQINNERDLSTINFLSNYSIQESQKDATKYDIITVTAVTAQKPRMNILNAMNRSVSCLNHSKICPFDIYKILSPLLIKLR